jgi:hypothetical protein
MPLALAWGATVHKAQGVTARRAVAHLGAMESTPDLAFAARSRVKACEGLTFDDAFSAERIKAVSARTMQDRLGEERRLAQLAAATAAAYAERGLDGVLALG